MQITIEFAMAREYGPRCDADHVGDALMAELDGMQLDVDDPNNDETSVYSVTGVTVKETIG